MNVDQILTPLDSAELDSKEQYTFYFSLVYHVLKEVIKGMEENEVCTKQETSFIKQYSDLLLYSIEAFRIKYMYDEEENMKIDLTESGFPAYLEFRYLINDLALRDDFAEKLPGIEVFKEQFLDQLLKEKKFIPKEAMYRAATVLYYTTVEEKYIFRRFVQGKILKSKMPGAEYLVSWCFYDITYNRPFICFMYFNYTGKSIMDQSAEIYEVLKAFADRSMDLDIMSYAIDKKLPEILPYKIKRIDLGPLHNVFAKDENEITHAMLESIGKKEIDLSSYAMSVKIDSIKTSGNFKEGNFFSKQYMQIWGDNEQEKYLFTSHRIIQMLYYKVPLYMDTLSKAPIVVAEMDRDVITQTG